MLILRRILLGFAFGIAVHAQTTVGTISGKVSDSAGAVIPNAAISLTEKATNLKRDLTTNGTGLFAAPELPPGQYEVQVSMPGFQSLVRDATVEAGKTTVSDFTLMAGAGGQPLRVQAVVPLVNYEGKNVVTGDVNRETTQAIPLNGRSSMQTASIEPGVQVAAAGTGVTNGLFTVTIPGGGGMGTNGVARYMVDGGIINDEDDGVGTSMNFSQEIVQATQVSSLSFDPSNGIGAGGAINTVTRTGGNDFHGDALFFYRDHNIASYPALKRSTLSPHPFFQRKDPGFFLGGPIKKNKLFFFGSYERIQQVQVINNQNDLPSLQAMNVIEPSPLHYNWLSARFDYHPSEKNVMFLRFTHDDSKNIFGPGNQSGWYATTNWSDQTGFGIVSTLSPRVVNDFHAFYHYWQNIELIFPPDPQEGGLFSANLPCISAVACIGAGDPGIASMVGSGTFNGEAGNFGNGPQMHQMRSYEAKDNVTWVKGKHQIRFGMDFEGVRTDYRPYDHCFPACISIYSAETTRALGAGFPAGAFANLPTSITSTDSLNQLPIFATPLVGTGIGVGNGTWPGSYEPGVQGTNYRFQPFVGDTWKATGNLTLNYGLSYNLETGLFPYNMPVPTYLNPILEGHTGGLAYGTGKGQPLNKLDFSPMVGFAWALGKGRKTVIRGGAGMYWDTIPSWWQMGSEAAMGPAGDGRAQLSPSEFTNIFPNMYYQSPAGVVPLPIGAPLPLNALSTVTLADFIQIINQQIPAIQAALQNANGGIVTKGPYQYSGVQVAKQGVDIFPQKFPFMRSYQTSLGFQRELPGGMVVSADWVRRQAEHASQGALDLNRFGRISDGLSPVIPLCTTTPDLNPNDECSSGSITFWTDNGRAVYDGLLVKLQKRLSHRYQFLASYALQKTLYTNAAADLDNYFATYGPTLAKHNLNISGTAFLPWGFRLTLNSNITSPTPAEPTISGVDLNGAGNATFPLALAVSNHQYNCFNYSCGNSQLAAAVAQFNAKYAGTKAFNGATVPKLTLPANYHTGAPIINQDVRITKEFAYRDRYKFQVFGEFFNILNIGNLTYGNLTLNSSAFGIATARVGQTSTFSSGGPRAEQVGARITF